MKRPNGRSVEALKTGQKIELQRCGYHNAKARISKAILLDERFDKERRMTTMSSRALIPSKVTARDPKGIKLTDLFAAAVNSEGLDEDQAQRVIENPEFSADLRTTLRKFATPQEFANEEVSSNYGYLSGYREPKSIGAQLKILRELFPTAQSASMNTQIILSGNQPGSEGLFAIPRWQLIAPTYGQAVELVLEALKKQRKGKFENYRQGQLGSDRLRETDQKRLALERLASQQAGYDILVVAAQFGLRHRGRSVRRARAVMGGQEFGLGACEIGIMLLTRPERLKTHDDLWIDSAGDEYSPGADGQFGSVPYFSFRDGQLEFDTYWVSAASDGCGSASAFFPQ